MSHDVLRELSERAAGFIRLWSPGWLVLQVAVPDGRRLTLACTPMMTTSSLTEGDLDRGRPGPRDRNARWLSTDTPGPAFRHWHRGADIDRQAASTALPP